MVTKFELETIVADIRYPGLVFDVYEYKPMASSPVYTLRVGLGGMWGRKWLLSTFMTRSEVVQTAFLAVRTWVEHEMREQFTYRSRAVFGPHISIDAVYDIAEKLDVRP